MVLFDSFGKKALFAVALFSAIFSYFYLPTLFSFTDCPITMNRKQAEEKAVSLIQDKHLLPDGYQTAVCFYTDTFFQYFVELSCGGKSVFQEIVKNRKAFPYKWKVRAFTPGNIEQVVITMTPDGIPYSFVKKLSETQSGINISREEAHSKAQLEAVQHWGVNFENYTLLDYSRKQYPSKRIDHIFVYQNENSDLGSEGKYRVQITVSGDEVTEVSQYAFIPESFTRTYLEMYNRNEILAMVGEFLFKILTHIGGLVICGFYLWTTNRLNWWFAFLTAVVLGVANFLLNFLGWPFIFLTYDTSLSIVSYVVSVVAAWASSMARMVGYNTIIFAVAATITAFRERCDRPSLWNFFSVRASGSKQMVWAVWLGYMVALIHVAYVIIFYLVMTEPSIGWWMPNDVRGNPNIFAFYMPWLNPIIRAFTAGISEELVYRALPLGIAAWVGSHFKRERLFLVIGMIAQMYIFGAAHVMYVSYPFYSRLVELLIPSFVWGILYLRYGLIPALISHTVYDIIIMSYPLFVMHAPGSLVNQFGVAFAGFVPLMYVLYSYHRYEKKTTKSVVNINSIDY